MQQHVWPSGGSIPPASAESWWRQWKETQFEPSWKDRTSGLTGVFHWLVKRTLMVLYLSPCSQVFQIGVPVHLGAHRVVDHLIEVGDSHAGRVEELSPQELPVEGDWRSRVVLLQQRCTCATVRVLKRQLSRDSSSLQPWQRSPLYKHQRVSTRRCAQTGSQKSYRGWVQWCWDLTSLEASEVSQSCTPRPKKNARNPNKHPSVRNMHTVLMRARSCSSTVRFMCSSSLLKASCSPPGNISSGRPVGSWPRSSRVGIPYFFSWPSELGVLTSLAVNNRIRLFTKTYDTFLHTSCHPVVLVPFQSSMEGAGIGLFGGPSFFTIACMLLYVRGAFPLFSSIILGSMKDG